MIPQEAFILLLILSTNAVRSDDQLSLSAVVLEKDKAVELKKVAAVDQIRLPCLLSSARVSRRVDESGSM